MQLVLVEDGNIIREMVAECRRDREHDVIEVATAEDALHRLIGSPAPQLVASDIDLGAGRSGLGFADWLHGRWPELNAIFANARLDRLNGRVPDRRETCFAKPFRLCKLIELVRSFVPLCTATSVPKLGSLEANIVCNERASARTNGRRNTEDAA